MRRQRAVNVITNETLREQLANEVCALHLFLLVDWCCQFASVLIIILCIYHFDRISSLGTSYITVAKLRSDDFAVAAASCLQCRPIHRGSLHRIRSKM